MDRDTKFSEALLTILEQAGVEAVRLPARSPNLNPTSESHAGSCVAHIHEVRAGDHSRAYQQAAKRTLCRPTS
ncbi:MAG: hypothetical protein ABSC02_08620 [Acidobacteriota bacterium]|jgi:hypothetical protein